MARILSVLILFGALLVGCSSGPPMANVKGKVTYKNQLVADGSIQFKPDTETPAAIPIKNGVYQGRTLPGFCRVIITAADDSIPDKFNKMSGIQKDVKEGNNEFDFDLDK